MASVALVLLFTFLQLAARGYALFPPAESVKMGEVTYEGDGCPSGTAEVIVNPDGKTLTAIYGGFTAVTDLEFKDRRKFCVLSVEVKYPQGFSFSLFQITMRGYVKLDEGVKATAQTSYHFSGHSGTPFCPFHFFGPKDDNFERSNYFVDPKFSDCDTVRDLNIKTEVRVNPRNFSPPRHGMITMDTTDMKLTQLFALSWKKCP